MKFLPILERTRIVMRGQGAPPQTMTVPLDEGETVVKIVEWHADPAIHAAPEKARNRIGAAGARPQTESRDSGVGAVAVNVGGAAVIAGAVLGFMTMGEKDHGRSPLQRRDLRRSRASGASAEGASYSTASTALTVAGLAGVGMGSYALLRPKLRQIACDRRVNGTVGIHRGFGGERRRSWRVRSPAASRCPRSGSCSIAAGTADRVTIARTGRGGERPDDRDSGDCRAGRRSVGLRVAFILIAASAALRGMDRRSRDAVAIGDHVRSMLLKESYGERRMQTLNRHPRRRSASCRAARS